MNVFVDTFRYFPAGQDLLAEARSKVFLAGVLPSATVSPLPPYLVNCTDYLCRHTLANLVTVENPDSDTQQWIHCVRCNSRLGWKYVQVPLGHICAKARFYLDMGSVSFWDGNQAHDAESGLPALDADPGQGAPVQPQPLPAGDGQAAFVQPEEDEHANADPEDEPLEEENELPAGFWYG